MVMQSLKSSVVFHVLHFPYTLCKYIDEGRYELYNKWRYKSTNIYTVCYQISVCIFPLTKNLFNIYIYIYIYILDIARLYFSDIYHSKLEDRWPSTKYFYHWEYQLEVRNTNEKKWVIVLVNFDFFNRMKFNLRKWKITNVLVFLFKILF